MQARLTIGSAAIVATIASSATATTAAAWARSVRSIIGRAQAIGSILGGATRSFAMRFRLFITVGGVMLSIFAELVVDLIAGGTQCSRSSGGRGADGKTRTARRPDRASGEPKSLPALQTQAAGQSVPIGRGFFRRRRRMSDDWEREKCVDRRLGGGVGVCCGCGGGETSPGSSPNSSASDFQGSPD